MVPVGKSEAVKSNPRNPSAQSASVEPGARLELLR